jgi:hypothetical protein
MYTMPSTFAGDYSRVIGPFVELNGIDSDALRTEVARSALGTSIYGSLAGGIVCDPGPTVGVGRVSSRFELIVHAGYVQAILQHG